MAEEWFVEIDDVVNGPLSPSEMKRWASNRRIIESTKVRKGAEGKWREARRVVGLFEAPKPAVPIASGGAAASPPVASGPRDQLDCPLCRGLMGKTSHTTGQGLGCVGACLVIVGLACLAGALWNWLCLPFGIALIAFGGTLKAKTRLLWQCASCGHVVERMELPSARGWKTSDKVAAAFLLGLVGVGLALYLFESGEAIAPRARQVPEGIAPSQLHRVDGATLLAPPRTQPASREAAIRAELAYLDEIDEIAWWRVTDNDIVIGFARRPDDFDFVVRGAAVRGNRAANFGVHVWAVPEALRDYKPGDPGYYDEVTARYGKVEP